MNTSDELKKESCQRTSVQRKGKATAVLDEAKTACGTRTALDILASANHTKNASCFENTRDILVLSLGSKKHTFPFINDHDSNITPQ